MTGISSYDEWAAREAGRCNGAPAETGRAPPEIVDIHSDSGVWCAGAPLENAPAHQPVVVTTSQLLSRTFPPREKLLVPWLTTQSLSMIYAQRGTGKTHVALGIAHALATAGGFLGWEAPKAIPVLYVDGEMPGADLQARVRHMVKTGADRLRFITPDTQPDGLMPNIRMIEDQQALERVIGDAQVIVVDNLSCLVRGGKENEAESWEPVAAWALRQRARGRSVLFIHHAGKGGQQRGTSKREDLLDTVIALKRPADYVPDQGARFEVHFEKARALYGKDVSPFEAALETLPDGTQIWATRTVEDTLDEQILELKGLGLSTREIGGEIGRNHSTVVRALKRLQDEGRYTPKPKKKKVVHGAFTKDAPAHQSDAEAYRQAKEGE